MQRTVSRPRNTVRCASSVRGSAVLTCCGVGSRSCERTLRLLIGSLVMAGTGKQGESASLAHRARLVGPGLRPDAGCGLRYDRPRMIDPWLLLKSISAGIAVAAPGGGG